MRVTDLVRAGSLPRSPPPACCFGALQEAGPMGVQVHVCTSAAVPVSARACIGVCACVHTRTPCLPKSMPTVLRGD